MSAVNNTNMVLPSIYRKEVSEKLVDLIDSFDKYAQAARAPAQQRTSRIGQDIVQGIASMGRPQPAPFIDLSTKTTHITHVTKVEAAKTETEEEKARKKKQEEDNLMFRMIVGAIAIAGGLLGAYHYGKASGEEAIVKTNKENLQGLRQYLIQTQQEAERNAQQGMQLANPRTLEIHMTNLDAAIRAGEIVISQKSKDAKAKLLVTAGFIAAAALAVFGAVINSVPLMAASGISAVVLTGYLLVKMGFGDATDELIAKRAKRVKEAFQALKNDIVKYKGFEDKNLPAPGYYYPQPAAPIQVQPMQYPQVNYPAQPVNPNYNPFVQSPQFSGPGSYNMHFVAPPQAVNAVLAGAPFEMPQHVQTPPPSAPSVDLF